MILPEGSYCYELRRDGSPFAREEVRVDDRAISGARLGSLGDRVSVTAQLDASGQVVRFEAIARRGAFELKASYALGTDSIAGSVSSLTGRAAIEARLGRLREVDGVLVPFKALIIAHARGRGAPRFTGRVATLDERTLAVAARKQTYRRSVNSEQDWAWEDEIGDRSEITVNAAGEITRIGGWRGIEIVRVAP